MRLANAAMVGLSFALYACSHVTDEIQPTAKVTEGLDQMSCEQIMSRADALAARATLVSGYPSGHERGGSVIKFVWPPAFKVKNQPEKLAELQLLRGEVQALSTAGIRKSCKTWIIEETSPEFSLTDSTTSVAPATEPRQKQP